MEAAQVHAARMLRDTLMVRACGFCALPRPAVLRWAGLGRLQPPVRATASVQKVRRGA